MFVKSSRYEPRHDKTNKMSERPAKTQISLGIRPVWSESSLSAWRNLGSLATHWAHSEDSDHTQADLSLRWAHTHFVGFVMFCHIAAHIFCYFSDLLHKEHERSNEFIDTMKGFYPDDLSYLLPGDIEVLREEILKAHLSWDQSHSDTSHDSSHETYQDNHTVDSHETSDETHTTVSLHSDIGTTPAADNSTGHHVRRRRSAISDSCKLLCNSKKILMNVL